MAEGGCMAANNSGKEITEKSKEIEDKAASKNEQTIPQNKVVEEKVAEKKVAEPAISKKK